MSNSQELFEINKRINQIKRNLQLREEKAQQWSVPYQKILHKPIFNQTCQSNFRNTHSGKFMPKQDEMNLTFNNKTERKIFLQKKAKQSRKKINEFHNQLKQLQQLLERKTKLYVKKQNAQEGSIRKQQDIYQRKINNYSPQSKSMNKTFSNSMLLNGILGKCSTPKASVRTLKDRVNPFLGLKVQKMIQLYQQAKHSGKQSVVNHTLGMGIEFTPYSHLKRDSRKQEEHESKPICQGLAGLFQMTNSQVIKSSKFPNNDEQKLKKTKNLSRMLQIKIMNNRQIYLDSPDLKQNIESSPGCKSKRKLNMFEHRMKKLMQQTSNIEACEGSYIEMLRKNRHTQKNFFNKRDIAKVRANNTYKTVFQLQ